MSAINQEPDQYKSLDHPFQFSEEITMTQCGFSFQAIKGLEIEIDETVYMYSDDGNLEISLLGGALNDNASIAEINDALVANLLSNVDHFDLMEAGTDSIQGIRGFLNEVHYSDADEDGFGRALICSPYLNQYFFMLVIASTDYWEIRGQAIFDMLKSSVQFHAQFSADDNQEEITDFSDLTLETNELIGAEEEFLLSIEKGDLSLLLAARAYSEEDHVILTQMTAPGGIQLYEYVPATGSFLSSIYGNPIIGDNGEVCLFFPRDNQTSLTTGEYSFTFETQSGSGLQEIQVILRSGRMLDVQTLDFNFWLAVENDHFNDQDYIEQMESTLFRILEEKMAPFNLAPGEITFIHPAMDELEAFSSINIDTDIPDCSYMISENVNNGRALNVGLVEQIYNDISDPNLSIKALSSGSPGMIMSTASPHACILLEWPAFQENITALADSIIEQLIIFSGIDIRGTQNQDSQPLRLNHEIAWRIRRHPLFYNAGRG